MEKSVKKSKNRAKRGAIISGGGAFGAYGAGTLAALNHDYDLIIGISTGALMSSFVALKEWDLLKEAYTSVTNKDIFDSKWYRPMPFNNDGKLNKLSVLYALITGANTLGTSNAMRKLIDKFLSEEHYNKIREKNISVIVGCQNINEKPSKVHHFDIRNCSFEDFKDWIWASANAPFVTSLIEKEWTDKDGNKILGEWTDGGLTELLSLSSYDLDILLECKEIDVIIHREIPKYIAQRSATKDFLHNIERSVDAMRYDIELSELMKNIQSLQSKGVTVNVYWLGRKLAENSLVFDKKIMTQWWEEGFSTAFDDNRVVKFDGKIRKK
jgi:hypothetical protein